MSHQMHAVPASDDPHLLAKTHSCVQIKQNITVDGVSIGQPGPDKADSWLSGQRSSGRPAQLSRRLYSTGGTRRSAGSGGSGGELGPGLTRACQQPVATPADGADSTTETKCK